MKKQTIFGFLLAFLMLAATLAPSVGYLNRLWEHVERISLQLRKGHLPTVRLVQTAENQAGFRWLNGHEFLFENQLFDLQKMETCGDSTLLFAWPDGEEMKLHAAFQKAFSKSQPTENQRGTFVFGMLDWSPFEVPEPFSFWINPVLEAEIQTSRMPEFWENWPGWPISPPPEIC